MMRTASRDPRLLLSAIMTSTKLMTSSPSSSRLMASTTTKTAFSRTSLDAERTAKEAVSVVSEALAASAHLFSRMMTSSRATASALPPSVPAISEAAWAEPRNP